MMDRTKIIALAGDIGSGKSVVSSILKIAGYNVYDCDERAKELMNSSPAIKQALIEKFGTDIYNNGILEKQKLSAIIFSNQQSLIYVNNIVHPVVRDDIVDWIKHVNRNTVFIETAILKQSGLDTIIDEVWNVSAPLETRIHRVIQRNNTSREKVVERVNTQDNNFENLTIPVVEIVNDGTEALLPQIIKLIKNNPN